MTTFQQSTDVNTLANLPLYREGQTDIESRTERELWTMLTPR